MRVYLHRSVKHYLTLTERLTETVRNRNYLTAVNISKFPKIVNFGRMGFLAANFAEVTAETLSKKHILWKK